MYLVPGTRFDDVCFVLVAMEVKILQTWFDSHLLLCINHTLHVRRDWHKGESIENGRRFCRCCCTAVVMLYTHTFVLKLRLRGPAAAFEEKKKYRSC